MASMNRCTASGKPLLGPLALLTLLMMFFCAPATVNSHVLHKQHPNSGSSASAKASDLADFKLPPWWHSFSRSNLDKQSSHAPGAKKDAPEEDEFTREVLGNAGGATAAGRVASDIATGRDSDNLEASDMKEDGLLSDEGSDNSSKEKESAADKLEQLIRVVSEEAKKEQEANHVDNSFQQAEDIKAKLDFEINRTRLILMRLRSLQRQIKDAHFLAKKMTESDVVSQNTKNYALNSLDKAVEKVKKVLGTM